MFPWSAPQPGGYAFPAGWTHKCGAMNLNPDCDPPAAYRLYTGVGQKCGVALQPYEGPYGAPISLPAGRRWSLALGGTVTGLCASRFTHEEVHTVDYGAVKPPHEIPFVPGTPPLPMLPVPLPAWLPNVAPDMLPIQQPVPTPKPLPYEALPLEPPVSPGDPVRAPRRGPRPVRRPQRLPRLRPRDVPSLDIEAGPATRSPARASSHAARPPEPQEKEKKGTPRHDQVEPWINVMGNLVNSYTEKDDLVNAVYQALDWRVRRWKGRDGVWRDRDITTDARMRRIYTEIGSLKFKEMIDNIIKEEAIDRAIGAIGQVGRRAVRSNPYYRGKQGLQAGGRFTKESWNEVLEEMRLGAAQAQQPRDYYVWKFVDAETGEAMDPTRGADGKLPKGGVWKRELRKGSRQVIPWLQNTYVGNRRTKVFRGTAEWWQYAFQRDENLLLYREPDHGYMDRPVVRRYYRKWT